MNVNIFFGEVSKSGGGKCGKSCCLHRYHEVVIPDWASSLELWHAVEDNRGKLERKALLWLRPELLGFVCGGREDAQAHDLQGRTASVGEVQEKTLQGLPEANPGIICAASSQNDCKKPCLCAWVYRHLGTICIQTSIATFVHGYSHLAELSSSVSSSHLREQQPQSLLFQNGLCTVCITVRGPALEIRDHFNSLLRWKELYQWFQWT